MGCRKSWKLHVILGFSCCIGKVAYQQYQHINCFFPEPLGTAHVATVRQHMPVSVVHSEDSFTPIRCSGRMLARGKQDWPVKIVQWHELISAHELINSIKSSKRLLLHFVIVSPTQCPNTLLARGTQHRPQQEDSRAVNHMNKGAILKHPPSSSAKMAIPSSPVWTPASEWTNAGRLI